MVTNNVTMRQHSSSSNNNNNVPAFLSKLWTLVEDEDTNALICWSQEGNSFLVLDEQRFAKDILPKFFKHSNMASFIRQLNMYGFRKVMSCDTGHMVKQERDGPVEFQHPYFKHGQDDLLEHIKRKVSSTRPGEDRRQEDLSRLLASVQNVHGRQEAVDARLTVMKRENEALWREISDLRQKHAHQQQLIKKLIQFIVTLVQNNNILNLKRKRPILMNGNGKKPKYIHQIYEDQMSDDVIICDVMEGEEPGGVTDDITESTLRVLEEGDVEVVEVGLEEVEAEDVDTPPQRPEDQERRAPERSSSPQQIKKTPSSSSSASLQQNNKPPSLEPIGKPSSLQQISKPSSSGGGGGALQQISKPSSSGGGGGALQQISKPSSSGGGGGALQQISKPSSSGGGGALQQISKPSSSGGGSALQQISKPSGGLVAEDPFNMMESIMNESAAISQNISLLGKVELMDYLDSIDCSLEDFQAMLFCKPFTDEDLVVSKDSSEQMVRERMETEDNTDKQLIQYTHCPLLAFLDGSSTSGSSPTAPSSDDILLHSSCQAPPSDLLLEEQQGAAVPPPPRRSSALVRLEPLTEAEASQETLFHLCELNQEEEEGGGGTDLAADSTVISG